MKITVIDLFAAPGGLSLGFEKAGFDVIKAVDKDEMAAKTYKKNLSDADFLVKDVRSLNGDGFLLGEDVDVVIGGPPCQGFSMAGRRNAEDDRNNLVYQFARLVREIQPKWFVMENVYGLASMENGEVIKEVAEEFKKGGYEARWKVLNATDYGVPQKRKRLFLIGNNVGQPIEFPEPTHGLNVQKTLDGNDLKPYKTVGDAFSEPVEDLPNHNPPDHTEKMVEKISEVEPGEKLYPSRSAGYYRLKWDDPSCAVAIAGGGEGPIHPSEDRVISVREAARLQTIPDWFTFEGNNGDAKQQVSNLVPPRLGEAVAKVIRNTQWSG